MSLLLLDLHHQSQAGVLVPQVVEQEDHEVVDHKGLVAFSARVHINGYAGVLQGYPLQIHKDSGHTGNESIR